MELFDSESFRALRRFAAVPLLLGLLGNTGCPTEEDNTGNGDDQVLAPSGDYGDAPDGYPTRYTPGAGVAELGSFPSAYTTTNSRVGDPGGHAVDIESAWLGPKASLERGVLDPSDPDLTHNMTDDDRRDDGVVALRALTPTSVTADIMISADSSAPSGGWFLNVLLDADGDGRWADTASIEEWRVQNRPVTVDPGGTVTVTLTDFWPVPSRRQAWLRLALSDSPVDTGRFGSEGWDGSGRFAAGEVEDYMVLRPVLDSAFDDAWDWDDDHRSREKEITRARDAIDAMRDSAERSLIDLDADADAVTVAVEESSAAAAEAGAHASASAFAWADAEASAISADAIAMAAAASASSASAASAAVGCAVASASSSSSASASSSSSALAASSASSAAGAAASASAEASAHATAAAHASAAAVAEADAFAVAYAEAHAHADALAVAYAEASAAADARAEAWAEAEAYADAYAEAMALGLWADAFADAFAIAWVDVDVDVDVHATAAADALAIAIASADAFALARATAQVHAGAAAAAASDASWSAAFAYSWSFSASFYAAFASEALSIAMGTASAAADTDALALALASGDCEDEYCSVYVETASTLTTTVATLSADYASLEAEYGVCLAGLEEATTSESGPPTMLSEVMLFSEDGIDWSSLPNEAVHLQVYDAVLFDGSPSCPGVCDLYDITFECAE